MPETSERKSIREIWRTIALALLVFVAGAGSSTLYGTAALSAHVANENAALEEREEKRDEAVKKREKSLDKLHQYQAEVHSRLVDLIEVNEDVLHEIRVSQAKVEAKLELLLEQELDLHHGERTP